jgi:O-antigen/teichoic acid export membrane protein
MLTFFMGRAPSPLESLAVFPVVHALSFVFRSLGLSFQEAAIALMGERHEHAPEVGRFALVLGLGSSLALGLVAFTPLADIWFIQVSGLTPELAEFAIWPARILTPLPALSVLLSYQRAVLVLSRRTRPITVATAVEVATIAALFVLGGWVLGMVGVTAAFLAFLGGRTGANVYLLSRVRATLGGDRPPGTG